MRTVVKRIRPYSAVNCPRCEKKTTGRLYRPRIRGANLTVKVCKDCSGELKDRGLTVGRVR